MEQGLKIAKRMESFVLEKASATVVDVSARQNILLGKIIQTVRNL